MMVHVIESLEKNYKTLCTLMEIECICKEMNLIEQAQTQIDWKSNGQKDLSIPT